MSFLKAHEILGTDLPIFAEKKEGMFLYEEIMALEENPSDYKKVGYLRVVKGGETFFQRLYKKG